MAALANRGGTRDVLVLPSFENYGTAHSKAGFSRLLDQLGLPQPATLIVKSASDLRGAVSFPSIVKTSEREDFRQQALQRLIVVAVAIALRRGEVAIFVIVVLGRRRRRFP
jgi:predicted ATP-grasp superfamily ATP-dependent carboligase